MNLLTVENLTKRFGGLVALKNVEFNVVEREILGLIGPNGCGKTTLFNCVNGFLKPEEGSIKFKGENIVGLSPYQIARKGIGRTFQLVKIFPKLTVKENTLVGLLGGSKASTWSMLQMPTRDQEERIDALLEFVGLLSKKDEVAQNIPYALKKKLEIARALLINPTLLLLDEPSAGLNPAEIMDQIKLIENISQRGITIIIVEHVMKLIMNISDRIVVLDMGEKIAEGKPKEIARDKRVISAYLGAGFIA